MKPWFEQSPWRRAAESALNYYVGRRDHSLIFSTRHGVAAVHLPSKRVYLSPELLPAHPEARAQPHDPVALREALLEGLLGHEAGHVHFSGAFPEDPALRALVNALEDERIERLMARRFPHLAGRFTLIGDLCCLAGQAAWSGSALEGCLVWRWQHDLDFPAWQCSDPELWADVRPLVEAAWSARSTAQVIWIATVIRDLVSPGGEPPEPPELPNLSPFAGGSGPGGDGDTDPAAQERPDPGEGEDPGEVPGGVPGDGPDASPGAEEDGNAPHRDPAGEQSGGGGAGEGGRPFWPAPRRAGPALLSPRRLSALLRPPEAESRRTSSRSRGRFEYARYASGSERPYRQRTEPGKPIRTALRLLVDVSGSMEGLALEMAVQAAVGLAEASTLAGVSLGIWAFDHTLRPLALPGTPLETVLQRLAALEAGGGTQLAPAIRAALKCPVPQGEAHTVVVLCDGALCPEDHEAVSNLLSSHPQVRVLIALIGEQVGLSAEWRSLQIPGSRSRLHLVHLPDLSRLGSGLEAALLALQQRG